MHVSVYAEGNISRLFPRWSEVVYTGHTDHASKNRHEAIPFNILSSGTHYELDSVTDVLLSIKMISVSVLFTY